MIFIYLKLFHYKVFSYLILLHFLKITVESKLHEK
jgi:hypothetical protein